MSYSFASAGSLSICTTNNQFSDPDVLHRVAPTKRRTQQREPVQIGRTLKLAASFPSKIGPLFTHHMMVSVKLPTVPGQRVHAILRFL